MQGGQGSWLVHLPTQSSSLTRLKTSQKLSQKDYSDALRTPTLLAMSCLGSRTLQSSISLSPSVDVSTVAGAHARQACAYLTSIGRGCTC